MTRIDLMFYSDGQGNVAFGKNLEEDRKVEDESSSEVLAEDEKIVVHVVFEENRLEVALDGIMAFHYLENAGDASDLGCTVFERLISEVFKAGMTYGRSVEKKGVAPRSGFNTTC